MKRCPKCHRTYPDDNQKFCTVDGGFLMVDQKPFDPNATMQARTLTLEAPPEEPSQGKPDSKPLPDFGETIATSSSAPTAVLPRKTGPTGSPTSANIPSPAPPPAAPYQSAPPSPQSQSGQLPTVAVALPREKSKLPLILGILAILLILGIGAVVAAFFLVIKPRLDQRLESPVVTSTENENVNNNTDANTADNTNANEEAKTEPEFAAPPDTVKFTNSNANLDGKLAEHYIDFSFYYPKTWITDPKAGVPGASNFAKVERSLPPDFTQENFAVGWYTSKGTYAADEQTFPQLVEILGTNLEKSFKEYRKVSEGPIKVNSLDGYEFRFTGVSRGTEKGDIQLWGRVIFLPTGVEGEQTGATLIMLATSLAPELSGVDDVGTKGEMPVILESFRLGKGR